MSAMGDEYELASRTIEIVPGKNEFVLATTPLFGVRVVLYEGDVQLEESTAAWWPRLDPVEGADPNPAEWAHFISTPVARRPGRHWLRVHAPDGYEPVPDRQVTLAPGPFPTIEIKVTRRR